MACKLVPLDRAFRDVNPKLEQVAANTLGAPEPILSGHALNELDDIGRDAKRKICCEFQKVSISSGSTPSLLALQASVLA
jgi:hypothetical protein